MYLSFHFQVIKIVGKVNLLSGINKIMYLCISKFIHKCTISLKDDW
jgi:hypothetical protein